MERRAWLRANRKMKKSADFEADDYDSQDEEKEDQTDPLNIKNEANKKVKNSRRPKVITSKTSKGVKAGESVDKKQTLNPKGEKNELSYVRRLLALLQAQGKM